ncbi:MAG: glutathione S-transferase N-terminal domain-containing protein [Burkholderiaceae bacterium]|nr:glutathione S-transferase N-terminal domain-containing protein [Burkholderiaceae bacterium]
MIHLHYYPGNASMTPHMVLRELGVPFELKLVDRAVGAQKSPAYLKLNPNGLIPVLVDGDLVLYETAAILLYLVDTHPGAGLAPAGSRQAAPTHLPHMSQDRTYYVYALKDPRTSPALPFYIGKGVGSRSHDHTIKPDATRKGKRIKEIEGDGAKVLVTRLVDTLTEEQAMVRFSAEFNVVSNKYRGAKLIASRSTTRSSTNRRSAA